MLCDRDFLTNWAIASFLKDSAPCVVLGIPLCARQTIFQNEVGLTFLWFRPLNLRVMSYYRLIHFSNLQFTSFITTAACACRESGMSVSITKFVWTYSYVIQV